jgi:hypothetical protein
MSAAAYERLKITGKAEFESVQDITVRQAACEHATARLRGVLTEAGSEYLAGKIAGEKVAVLDSETGAYPPIFEGMITGVRFSTENGLNTAELELSAGSVLLDLEEKSKSYQNTELTYDEIIADVLSDFSGGDSVIAGEISGKRIGNPVIRYRETAWGFIKRLASHYNLPVFSDVRSGAPRVYVGVPDIRQNAGFAENVYKVGFGKEYYENGGAAAGLDKADFLRYTVESGNSYFLGWNARFKGRSLSICEKSCRIEKGLLIYEYTLAGRGFCGVNRKYNRYFAGMSLLGRVLSTGKDDVRLQLDIDGEQEAETAYPWPWAPETGNQLYAMPRAGSRVSLYFGDDDEANGRVINCIRENDPIPAEKEAAGTDEEGGGDIFKPDFRSLTTEYAKTMFLYTDSVGFSTKKAEQPGIHTGGRNRPALHYIKVLDGRGIELSSKSAIAIEASGHIRIKGKKVIIQGKEYAYLGRVSYRPETDSEALARFGVHGPPSVMPTNFPRRLVPDPKSELLLRYDSGTGLGAEAGRISKLRQSAARWA